MAANVQEPAKTPARMPAPYDRRLSRVRLSSLDVAPLLSTFIIFRGGFFFLTGAASRSAPSTHASSVQLGSRANVRLGGFFGLASDCSGEGMRLDWMHAVAIEVLGAESSTYGTRDHRDEGRGPVRTRGPVPSSCEVVLKTTDELRRLRR